MTGRPVQVALVMEHPAQQFTSGFQLLSARPAIQLTVYYWSVATKLHDPGFGRSLSWDVDLLGGYEWLAPAPSSSAAGRVLWFARQLRAARPEVVICYGWGSLIARASIVFCLVTRTRLLLYGDATWQHTSRGWRRIFRSTALRILTRVCAGAISTGTFNREFYIRYGMHPGEIWDGVCPADTKLFGQARTSFDGSAAKDASHLNIGFAGKLIERKGVDELLRACALLGRADEWSLTVIGDGPAMAELQALTQLLGLDDRVVFHGFANTTEMPKLLASFDVVVVPSRIDMRVLITIEAMVAGAAIVVSDATAVWGPGDLVEDGVTGLVYPSGDSAALAKLLRRLIEDAEFLTTLRANGAARATGFGPEKFAQTMARAIQGCPPSGRQRSQG
jgi:glycosyltransferase involved in cell wall biosynthesis